MQKIEEIHQKNTIIMVFKELLLVALKMGLSILAVIALSGVHSQKFSHAVELSAFLFV